MDTIMEHYPQLIPRQDIPGFNNSQVTRTSEQSAGQFAASLVTGAITFAVQFLIFLLIKDRLARIYQPRTYLVPPRERTDPAHSGWFKWIKSVLSTSNSEFVQKCGLDAYFFLRYLRTLLKIFIPASFVILPVLLTLNARGGRGPAWALDHAPQANVTGLNQLAWGNVRPSRYQRYWGHWLMALFFVVWICYVAFDELKNYIRMRQAYITSPQHRLRASATTVLVSSIPPKWCTVEALDGLYDVFPGGLRNIWINRNFDELSDKVKQRDKIAAKLEAAETELIKKCYKRNEGNIRKAEREAGRKLSKTERKNKAAAQDEKGRQQAEADTGVTSGDPHQIKHTIHDALGDPRDDTSSSSSDDEAAGYSHKAKILPVPIVGEGIQAVTDGFSRIGERFLGGFRGMGRGVNDVVDDTNGFAPKVARPQDHDAADHQVPRNEDVGMGARISHSDRPPERSAQSPISPKSPLEVDGTMDMPRDDRTPENDRRPLNIASPVSPTSTNYDKKSPAEKLKPTFGQKFVKAFGLGGEEKEPIQYPAAFNEEFEQDGDDAVWRKYLTIKDRETHRLPIFGWQWMFPIPFVGQQVDTIYWCRKELARLNVEIEDDQANPDRFPLMNSAFIQFNHQVAAHMACQSVSHHLPKQMAPRLVEIDPNDVIWDNMSLPWWQDYVRTAVVVSIVVGMIALWAIPIAFTSALSQLTTLAESYSWLRWVLDLPSWFRSFLQGVLPIVLLALLMFLLPVILRALCRFQGMKSGMLVELSVQKYYFFFIFVQLFLIVTVGSSVFQLLKDLTSVNGIASVPSLLGSTIPTASNYFFSYMLLQALSVSAGALLQVGSLVTWFLLAPILDSTARAKFKRQTTLSNIQWGTFFPVYTNLACIGIIYSVVAPLILIFNIITFALFWFVYRYNTLYVTRFTNDTGGLLYPNAINCTFVGVYVMELALVGLFLLVRDENNQTVCEGQAIGMIVVLILTAGYQILLNNAFSPLFRYLPITLEDDAVRRDEEFARAMRARHGHGNHGHSAHEKLIEDEREDEEIEVTLEQNERNSFDRDRREQAYEMKKMESAKEKDARDPRKILVNEEPELAPYTFQNPEINMDLDHDSKALRAMKKTAHALPAPVQRGFGRRRQPSWADRDNHRNRRSSHFGQKYNPSESDRELSQSRDRGSRLHPDGAAVGSGADRPDVKQPASSRGHLRDLSDPRKALDAINNFNPLAGAPQDLEAQRKARAELSDALYSGINDELEDLTPEQRDALVQRAFQHSALRARRPVIWIPRDELGVSDDEVRNVGRFAQAPKQDTGSIWISNIRQGLDSKGRCVYSGAPPDFSEVDLIQL